MTFLTYEFINLALRTFFTTYTLFNNAKNSKEVLGFV